MTPSTEIELLKSIQEVQNQFIAEAKPRIIFDNLLVHLLRLTDSEYGFIGEIQSAADGSRFLKTHAISNISWSEETRLFYERNMPVGMEFRNLNTLFGAVIAAGQSVIANDPSNDPRSGGLPEGHPRLHAFLGAPIYHGDSFVGMVGVANRVGGYDHGLVGFLAPFLATSGSIINAYTEAHRRRKAEIALRESEQRYRGLVEDQPEAICRFTPDGRLTFVNRAYANYFGKDIEECERLDFFDLVPKGDHPAIRKHLNSMGRDKPMARIEHQVIASDGSIRWMQWTDRALLDKNGTPIEFQSFGVDITERKKAEQERRDFEAQMLQIQKLESLGVLAGGIAHDFNNLLTGVLGNATLAKTSIPADHAVKNYLENIETAAQRAADLCKRMLAYSGKGKLDVTTLNLSTLVQEMVDMLELSISKKALLRLDLRPQLPPIVADRMQVSQIVMNLITNASDAIGDAVGNIRVSTGVHFCDRAYLAGNYLADELPEGEYVYVEVEDSGCGIDAVALPRIFDPFFTTKFAGRGLGLAAVLGIVRSHRGAIRLESEPGRGTTFRALFPGCLDAHAASLRAHEEGQLSSRDGTILVVDDEDGVRGFAKESAKRFGYKVLEARDGSEALEIFRNQPDQISAVLLDMTMPKLSGEEVMREIRRLRPEMRVILTSGYTEDQTLKRLSGARFSQFLQKPYTHQQLIACLDSVITSAQD